MLLQRTTTIPRDRRGTRWLESDMPDDPMELVQGTLDMLIMKALIWGPKHGWDVLCWLREISGGELAIEEGAIYPALYRMEDRGFIKADWGISENNRRAKYYRLTAKGRNELTARSDTWGRYVRVLARILAV